MTDNKDFLNPEDELLLQQFFTENKQVIPDDGFSRRVARRLPVSAIRLERFWTAVCVIVGIVLFFVMDGIRELARPLIVYAYRGWELISNVPVIDLSLPRIYCAYVMAAVALLIVVGYNVVNKQR